MGVAVAVALLPMVVNTFYHLTVSAEGQVYDLLLMSPSSGAAVWCVIVVVVLLEPAQGSVLRKGALRLLGVGLASGLGVGILELARAVAGGYE